MIFTDQFRKSSFERYVIPNGSGDVSFGAQKIYIISYHIISTTKIKKYRFM